MQGRDDMIDFAKQEGIPVSATKRKPYSTDENMFHISYESGILVRMRNKKERGKETYPTNAGGSLECSS